MTQLIVLCLATLLLFAVQTLTQSQDQCPEKASGCTCMENNSWVYCEGKGLTGLPSPLRTDIELLSLGGNNIGAIYSRMFAGLSSLKLLPLYGNQISSVAVDAFAGLEKLEQLDLSNNQITVIFDHTFANLTSLRYLHLHDNRLKRLGTKVVEDLHFEIRISLYGNPWNCDCDFFDAWMRFKWVLDVQPKCGNRDWNRMRDTEICFRRVTTATTSPSTPTSKWLSVGTIVVIILAVICSLSLVFYFVWKAIRKSSDQSTGQHLEMAVSGSDDEKSPLLGDSLSESNSS